MDRLQDNFSPGCKFAIVLVLCARKSHHVANGFVGSVMQRGSTLVLLDCPLKQAVASLLRHLFLRPLVQALQPLGHRC